MFVGHYAAGFALKSFEKRASLGVLFLAVQLVDIVFFPLVLLGIERVNIVENFTQATHFELEFMPYTHSLLGAAIWALLAYGLFRWVVVKQHAIALVVALAVLSHWFLDVAVHTPDMPIWSDASMKLGFGLWNSAIATYLLEAVVLLLAAGIYLRVTTATSAAGRYGTVAFVGALLLVNIANVFGPLQSDSKIVLAISALSAYFLFAAVAFWIDRKRT